MPPDTFYWIHDEKWVNLEAKVSHVMVLYCDANKKQSLFYVELFNLPGIAVILPFTGDTHMIFYDAIDVLSGKKSRIKN